MKTALYGVAFLIIGILLQRYSVNWPPLYGIVVAGLLSFAAVITGYVLEAWIINSRFWGEDRYERD
jgi:hypothetical protein